MAINIDPKIEMALGATMTVASVLVGFGSQLTTLTNDHVSAMVIAGCTIATGVCGGLITFLGAGSSSKPGPLATPDPPAVQAATLQAQKQALIEDHTAAVADVDKQIAAVKPVAVIGAIILALGLMLAHGHAYAFTAAKGGLCSAPACICPNTKASLACQTSGGGILPGPGDVVSQLIAAKAQILATLQVIDSMARQPIEGQPGQTWAPDVHLCIAGMGTEGQPGYVPGLAVFVEAIKTPPAPPAVPAGTPQSPLLALFQADLAARALQMNLQGLLSQGVGIPTNLRVVCGGVIVQQGAQIQTLAALIALLIPK